MTEKIQEYAVLDRGRLLPSSTYYTLADAEEHYAWIMRRREECRLAAEIEQDLDDQLRAKGKRAPTNVARYNWHRVWENAEYVVVEREITPYRKVNV